MPVRLYDVAVSLTVRPSDPDGRLTGTDSESLTQSDSDRLSDSQSDSVTM
jgi:hypothetical protein